MLRGRPPNEPLPDWPALMTTSLASRYLSMDENSLRPVAKRAGIAPVDLGLELERWRRSDLDRLVKSLPEGAAPLPLGGRVQGPVLVGLSETDLDRIAARVRGLAPVVDRHAYSIKDAAFQTGLSRTTLYRLAKEGALRPIRVGGRTLIPRDQIDALLQTT